MERSASPPKASFSGWLASSLSALVVGGADGGRESGEAAEQAARREVESLCVAHLFRDSAHLPLDALTALVAALSAAAVATPPPAAPLQRPPSPPAPADAASPASGAGSPQPPPTPGGEGGGAAPATPLPQACAPPPSTPVATPPPLAAVGGGATPEGRRGGAAGGVAEEGGGGPSVRRRAVALALLAEVLARNRDRFEVRAPPADPPRLVEIGRDRPRWLPERAPVFVLFAHNARAPVHQAAWPLAEPCFAAALGGGGLGAGGGGERGGMLAAATVEHASHCVLRLAARLTHREGAVESTVRLLGRLPAGFTDAAGDVPGPSAAADGRGGRRGEGGLPVLSPKAAAALGAEMAAMLLAGGGAGLATRGTWLGLVRFAAAVSASADERGARAGSEARLAPDLPDLCTDRVSSAASNPPPPLPPARPPGALLAVQPLGARLPAARELARAVAAAATARARLPHARALRARRRPDGGCARAVERGDSGRGRRGAVGGVARRLAARAARLLLPLPRHAAALPRRAAAGASARGARTRPPEASPHGGWRLFTPVSRRAQVLAGDPPALPPAVWAEAFEQAPHPPRC